MIKGGSQGGGAGSKLLLAATARGRRRKAAAVAWAAAMACAPAAASGPPSGVVWEASLRGERDHRAAVADVFDAFEAAGGRDLAPGERGRVGLKVDTRSGRGLSTPLDLLRAAIAALAERGFARDDILIVDQSAHHLRQAGILPPLSAESSRFAGCPVIALDSGEHYDREWFYESPLPPPPRGASSAFGGDREGKLPEGADARKSFLPAPLLFEVDFWINLPVVADSPVLGVDGALANATIWNVSNARRFMAGETSAATAIAEIAAIPELKERLALHVVSLEAYQFIGGPEFRSLYTRSEPRIWASADPVALDRLLLERVNRRRRLEGFDAIEPLPRQLRFAHSLDLGVYRRDELEIVPVGADAPRAAGPGRADEDAP